MEFLRVSPVTDIYLLRSAGSAIAHSNEGHSRLTQTTTYFKGQTLGEDSGLDYGEDEEWEYYPQRIPPLGYMYIGGRKYAGNVLRKACDNGGAINSLHLLCRRAISETCYL